MPGKTPVQRFVPIKFGGPLNEAQSPSKVGSDGLTANSNVTYRRFGAWGKRPGTTLSYIGGAGNFPAAPISGVRFYAAFPTVLTRTVVAAAGALWVGNDPSNPAVAMTKIADFVQANTEPVGFCTARDPAALAGSGADVLIITGASLTNGSFAVGQFNFSGTPTAGQVVTATLTYPAQTPIVVSYTLLATDTTASISSEISTLINESAAVVAGTPFLAQSIPTSPTTTTSNVLLGALLGGAAGNGIDIAIAVTGTGLVVSASGPTLTGGGLNFYGPLKYDGTTLSGLSPFIPNAFTGCVSWHNHVWLWGDPKNPLTVFATDIDEPEGFTFMTQYGGYDIGDGTGGQAVTALAPIGNILYAFNSSASYAITGYDFQSGEYEFAIEPAIADSGTPYKECVVSLRNALIYWDGVEFQRLLPGALETEQLSASIPYSCGLVSQGKQSLIRGTAGSFSITSGLGTTYTPLPSVTQTPYTYARVAYFAVDIGNGVADTVLVYDDEASRLMQYPAWSTWTGWQVAAWVTFGASGNAKGTGNDVPSLFMVPSGSYPFTLVLVGGSATSDEAYDAALNIAWSAQTGWFDLGTPQLASRAHRIFLDVEARSGLNLTGTLIAAGPLNGTQAYVEAPVALTFQTSVGQGANETAQELIATIEPALQGYRFLLILNDAGSQVPFEVTGALLDVVTEGFTP